jgi:hypothetical protein
MRLTKLERATRVFEDVLGQKQLRVLERLTADELREALVDAMVRCGVEPDAD